jgi:hypothetical protein
LEVLVLSGRVVVEAVPVEVEVVPGAVAVEVVPGAVAVEVVPGAGAVAVVPGAVVAEVFPGAVDAPVAELVACVAPEAAGVEAGAELLEGFDPPQPANSRIGAMPRTHDLRLTLPA